MSMSQLSEGKWAHICVVHALPLVSPERCDKHRPQAGNRLRPFACYVPGFGYPPFTGGDNNLLTSSLPTTL